MSGTKTCVCLLCALAYFFLQGEIKGNDSISLANSTGRKMKVVLTMTTVRNEASTENSFVFSSVQPNEEGVDYEVNSRKCFLWPAFGPRAEYYLPHYMQVKKGSTRKAVTENKMIEQTIYPHKQGDGQYSASQDIARHLLNYLVDVPVPVERGLGTLTGTECLSSRIIRVCIHGAVEVEVDDVEVQSVVPGHGLIISEDKDRMLVVRISIMFLLLYSYIVDRPSQGQGLVQMVPALDCK